VRGEPHRLQAVRPSTRLAAVGFHPSMSSETFVGVNYEIWSTDCPMNTTQSFGFSLISFLIYISLDNLFF
jgi:hypothetical protein